MRVLSSAAFKAFRNAMLIGATGLIVKLLYLTVRFDVRGFANLRDAARGGQGVVFVFWHENLLLPLGHESRKDALAVVSAGKDGDFAARILKRWFRVGAVRGSSSRQALSALRGLLRDGVPGRKFAITPDGPRGPRRTFDAGAVFIASRSGLPIVALGGSCSRAYRLKTWDKMRVPLPFSRVVLEFADPIEVPKDLGREDFEPFASAMRSALNAAQERAEQRAESR